MALFDKKVSAAYIADGHHRAVAASQYAKKVKEQHPDPVAPRDYNYFLTCLLPSNQLRIFDYNRIVKSMAGLDEKTLVKKISEKFLLNWLCGIPTAHPSRTASACSSTASGTN